jgi:hypothetical protein
MSFPCASNGGVVNVRKPYDAERHGRPQDPRAELPPLRVRAVRDDTHERVEDGVPHAHDQEERTGCRGRDAERVGVEGELEHQHRLEDEVRRGVAEAVTDLLRD